MPVLLCLICPWSALISSSYDIINLFIFKVMKDIHSKLQKPWDMAITSKTQQCERSFIKRNLPGLPGRPETPACWKPISSLLLKWVRFCLRASSKIIKFKLLWSVGSITWIDLFMHRLFGHGVKYSQESGVDTLGAGQSHDQLSYSKDHSSGMFFTMEFSQFIL